MSLITRYPVRLTVPIFLFLLALAAESVNLQYNQRLADEDEERAGLEFVRKELTELQEGINYRLRKNDWEAVQSVIAARAADSNVIDALFIDDQNLITASTRIRMIGRPAQDALPHLSSAAVTLVRDALSGTLALSADRMRITAYSPVILGAKPGELRPHRVGVLYLDYDLTYPKALRRHALLRQGLTTSGFLGACFLLLGLFLHLILTRRVGVLVTAAGRFAAGDLKAHASLTGQDELAQIGRAFDQMAADVAGGQEALRAAAIKYRIVAENTYDWEFWLDPDGRFVYVSPSCERVTGYKVDQFLTDPDLADRIIQPDDRAQFKDHRHNVLHSDIPEEIEYRIVRADGTVRWVGHVCQPVFDDNGTFLGTRGNNRDITERKSMEEELRRLNIELEQRVLDRTAQLQAANKEMEAFTYTVSHDLRAPLRHVDGFVNMLVSHSRSALDKTGQHYLDSIAEAAHHMGTLIDALLQFSRTGRVNLELGSVDMNRTLKEAQAVLVETQPKRKIDWVIHDLPPVRGDATLIRQVWANLLENAVKFTRSRETARIEVGAREEKDEIVFMVKDNGAGFDMAHAEKLFGVFQRMHSSQEFDGTGIGLATVHRILTRHGGRIWAEAAVDQGATFFFALPKYAPH